LILRDILVLVLFSDSSYIYIEREYEILKYA
jgi:hypothetical protein